MGHTAAPTAGRTSPTVLKTRLATLADAAAISAIYTQSIVDSPITFDEVPLTPEQMAGRMAACLPLHPWFVAEIDGRVVGYTYSAPHSDRASYRWTVNIGVFVHDSAHRRGVARALYDALLPQLRRHGFFNAIAGITIGNDASVRFHEGLGFKQAALYKNMGYKVGAWHDVGWWQLPLQPYVDNPAFPAAR